MRDTVIKTIVEYGKKDSDVELITGDLGHNVLEPFSDVLPNQYINAGIAEQNLMGVAAGLAKEGKKVFTYSIGNFTTLRCIEQIRNDCTLNNLNVNIVCVGSGFTYGPLGMTHHATEDIAIMRALPNITITSPCDALEAKKIVDSIIKQDKTCYLRLGRGGEPQIHDKLDNFHFGKAIKISEGEKIAIFVTGTITSEVLLAREELEKRGISTSIYSFHTIKPIDTETILDSATNYDLIVTVEEHNIVGGFGSAVAEVLMDNNVFANLLRIGINDEYPIIVGSKDYLRHYYKVDHIAILDKIMKRLNK